MAASRTDALRRKIAVLMETDLERLEQLLAVGYWAAAIDMLDDIDANAKAVSRACTRVASRTCRAHWSPLLDQEMQ